MKQLAIISAMDRNGLIGAGNTLPWNLPADLAHFKKLTLGHPVIMGSNTWNSLPKKPLPGRQNIVLSRTMAKDMPECDVARSLDEALSMAKGERVFIIGGASVYQEALPRTDVLYLTRIDGEFEGDTHFPKLDEDAWQETEHEAHEKDEKNPHDYPFVVLKKK